MWFSDKVLRLTKPDKTQRMIGFLCAVLKVMSYSLQTFPLPINLPDYVL
jgi:hypothetical protein